MTSMPSSKPPGPLRPSSKNGMQAIEIGSGSTGRRNARRARFAVIRSAHSRSRSATSGSQTNSLRRLAVRVRPVELNGPTMLMPAVMPGTRAAPPNEKSADAVGGVLVVGGARALDERDDDLVRAGRDLQRDIREALHELARAPARRRVLMSASSSSPPMSARNCSLRSTSTTSVCRVSTARGYRPAPRSPAIEMRYSPSAGNMCVKLHAAARAERHAGTYALWSAAGRREIRVRDLRLRLADGEVRDGARGVHVLLDERRRRAERGRDVREAMDLDLGRQVFLGIDLDVEQRLHGRGVLGAIEALRRDVAARAVAARARRSSARGSR